MTTHRFMIGVACFLLACGEASLPAPLEAPDRDWPSYGGDPGGRRYSDLAQITPANVAQLEVAWTHRHGDVSDGRGAMPATSAFEATPILVDGLLTFCTPMNRVVALDPATGEERWRFDPGVDTSARYANQLVCRGVSSWRAAPGRDTGSCARRIFTGTIDARLIALDATSGEPCAGFGRAGEVDLLDGVQPQKWRGEYQVTSPPAIVGDIVVVGSAVSDNGRVDAPSGVVRGYDARTGAQRWRFDLAPPGTARTPESLPKAGTPNVWAPIAVDPQRDLVFLPTGNPSPDYFRGESKIDHYGSSVVALRGSTGKVVWRFQTVHHDLWDYDVPAQPTLASVRQGGREIPALVQATKMGHLFVLHRETGRPLLPVEERPVPDGAVEGEWLSPTQPFPVLPPPLVPAQLRPEDAWGLTPLDRAACRRKIEALRSDGIFTPPTLQGSVMFPGNAGGSNWGGVAFDPERGRVFANTMSLAFTVTLFPADDYERQREEYPDAEVSPQRGTPYGMRRERLLSPLGLPCNPPPWGTLAAVDLGSGAIRWQVPLGTVRDIAPVPVPIRWGVPNLGGPLATASGLVFIGAAFDDYLRAFDSDTGEELWKGRLPAGGQATPMTYAVGGRQYVVIAAGGHGRAGTTLGDSLVAYALERP